MENNQDNVNTQAQNGQQSAGPAIDYDRIQTMLTGTLQAKEDTALKAYFRQQGLTADEVQQAIMAFKAEKAKNTPDIDGLTAQADAAVKAAAKANLRAEAMLLSDDLGITVKTAQYVLRMADIEGVADETGKVDAAKLKAAMEQVLTDIPQLKGTAGGGPKETDDKTGFRKVGSSGGGSDAAADQIAAIFGNK